MKTWNYLKKLFISAGTVLGPVVTVLSLIGLTYSLYSSSTLTAFVFGFTAFLGGVYMLKSATYHQEDIVVDVNADDGGDD